MSIGERDLMVRIFNRNGFLAALAGAALLSLCLFAAIEAQSPPPPPSTPA